MYLVKTRNMEKDHYRYFDRMALEADIKRLDFCLHSHEHYEIYLFLEGDANYIIEEKCYSLEPLDLFVIKKNEFHQVLHNSLVPYHRIYIWIEPEFFEMNNCQRYEEKFLQTPKNSGSKIPASVVRSSGIYDIFLKIKKYSDDYKDMNAPVIHSLIIELLHLISQTQTLSTTHYSDKSIQPVIQYLNQNFTENITLDMLQDKYFISKYHLCRKFHDATGLTVHEYIRKKRLAYARELKAEGMNLGDVAMKSGFCDYSSFYRAYQKEYGCSPKDFTEQK